MSKLIGSSGNNTVRQLIENHNAVKQRTEMYKGLSASEYGGTRAYHTLFVPKCIENVELFGGD